MTLPENLRLDRHSQPYSVDDAPRVLEARARSEAAVLTAFAAAGLDYPPGALHLRAYKFEKELEVWAQPAGDPSRSFVLIVTLPILGLSGTPGPKRREGDLQVPEGFYRIDRFNPRSQFYLSLGLDYPNAADRLLATDSTRPGSDIFIHGGDRSRGCLAIGDEAMAFLYLAALDSARQSGRTISAHLFPCRTDTLDGWVQTLTPWTDADPTLHRFWDTLATSARQFTASRLPPHFRVGSDGAYQIISQTDHLTGL